jgi:hypothetical protein
MRVIRLRAYSPCGGLAGDLWQVIEGRDRDGHEVAIAGVEQTAAGAWRLSDLTAGKPNPDQFPVTWRRRGGQTSTAGSFCVDLPSAEPTAQARLGVSREHQPPARTDQKVAQAGGGVAVSQQFGIVDEYDTRTVERRQACVEFFVTERVTSK